MLIYLKIFIFMNKKKHNTVIIKDKSTKSAALSAISWKHSYLRAEASYSIQKFSIQGVPLINMTRILWGPSPSL